jgi:inosine-uridine nucleoside N-ribohydrolase
MTIKLLLDTDLGSDIDDAVCLAYLLANPRCDLLGITTVTGEPEQRACLSSVLCTVAGIDVPIFPGAAQPLLVEQRQPQAPQAAALGKWPHRRDFPAGQAVDFLRRTIRAHPGQVTLLTIGPLTNIGLLFALDPAVPSLLAGLVSMCGSYLVRAGGDDAIEWNARLDPQATAIVYGAQTNDHRSIGLDVTRQVTLPASEVRQRFQAPLLRPVLDFAEVWFRAADNITFHDPLAAATVFNPDICKCERGRVDVEAYDQHNLGLTRWTPDPANGPHRVALGVDPQRFFDEFFSVF